MADENGFSDADMKILFIHQSFPAQFRYLAAALVDRGHDVTAISIGGDEVLGVARKKYQPLRGSTPNIHPWLVDFETKVIRGEAVLDLALGMRHQGYCPDVIVAHCGWGESLFIKEVWPEVPLGIYCEFYYQPTGADVNFDPEFIGSTPHNSAAITLKNINNRLHFDVANAGISPTAWQRSSFPEPFRQQIKTIHEGVDTQLLKPNPLVRLTINGDLQLKKDDEVITFVSRNLEPYRGFHSFMRSLPSILKSRPNAHVLIIGGDGVSYGAYPPEGLTWRKVLLDELAEQLDLSRIHFLGQIDYATYVAVLQLSTVHVYLTYPFVLGWSCIEAMSVGCAIVGSDTAPVQEVITHNQTGRLVNFFSPSEISHQVVDLIEDLQERKRLGDNARQVAIAQFDRRTICLPKQVEWVEKKFI